MSITVTTHLYSLSLIERHVSYLWRSRVSICLGVSTGCAGVLVFTCIHVFCSRSWGKK